MPAFNAEVAHCLGQAEATSRLKVFAQQMLERFQDQLGAVEGTWNGHVMAFSVTATGVTVKGTLTVEEVVVRIDGKLPLIALPFRSTIETSIATHLTQALA